jgi:hypothetical protein
LGIAKLSDMFVCFGVRIYLTAMAYHLAYNLCVIEALCNVEPLEGDSFVAHQFLIEYYVSGMESIR